MHSELKQTSAIENLFDLSENTSSIEHNGKTLSVKWIDGYQSKQTLYQSRYAILNNKILLVVSSGSPNQLDVKNTAFELDKIHKRNNFSGIDVIWDVRNVQNPTIRVRKQLIKLNYELSKYWNNRFLIVSPKYKTLVRIYKFIYQGKVEHLYFADSIKAAIDTILLNNPIAEDQDKFEKWSEIKKDELLKKSKEELVEIIEQNTKSQEDTTHKILEAIGHISWGGKFKKVDIEVHENDPNYGLVNAFSLLQQDVAEIIKEYKELNQNLELKVAERIVDFIDKESNLRAILDNSDRLTWLMNTRFELIDFNMAFTNEVRKRYNIIPKVNQNVLDIIPNEKERRVWRERFESALEGKPGIYLDQAKENDQDHVWEIKTFPIKEIGKIKGVSVFIEDITELKNSQFRLIEKNRDLQKVNSELDSFVYRVSHDLRAPLTSILGLISLMKIETSHEKVSEYINLQEKSIYKLDLFIKEIINLSRNSRLGITVSQIHFQELLDEIFEGQNYTKTAEQVERICSIEEGLSFYTDRQRLSIILNNLISNSLKYTNSHIKSPFVKIKVYADNADCIIEVSDNGIGISEIYLPKIFEMFFRATQEFTGSGLGLYIVKETVEKLKGKITVKSKTRQGTTFKVVLPNLKERFDAAPKLDD